MHKLLIIACLLARAETVLCQGGPPLLVGPNQVTLNTQADSLRLPDPVAILVEPAGNAPVPFTATFSPAGTADCYVVSPSTGIAPQLVYVGINPSVFPYARTGGHPCPGGIGFAPISNPDAKNGASIVVDYIGAGLPAIASVVNSATLQPGISPGELVTIYGTNLSSPPQSAQFSALGQYPTTLGGTTVTVNGVQAALLYVSQTQINAIAPYEIAGQQTAKVSVTRDGSILISVQAPVSDTSPGIFTATQNGAGQGAILNNPIPGLPGTVNSSSNPAPQGSVVSIFATGSGLWNPTLPDGIVMLGPYHDDSRTIYIPVAPVSLTIGGQPAKIAYAGPAPYMPVGVIQINAVVPTGIGAGQQPIVLTIGANNNSQQSVTVAVQ
jgi:uncharacterized protein (TIGR03437 family)